MTTATSATTTAAAVTTATSATTTAAAVATAATTTTAVTATATATILGISARAMRNRVRNEYDGRRQHACNGSRQ